MDMPASSGPNHQQRWRHLYRYRLYLIALFLGCVGFCLIWVGNSVEDLVNICRRFL